MTTSTRSTRKATPGQLSRAAIAEVRSLLDGILEHADERDEHGQRPHPFTQGDAVALQNVVESLRALSTRRTNRRPATVKAA